MNEDYRPLFQRARATELAPAKKRSIEQRASSAKAFIERYAKNCADVCIIAISDTTWASEARRRAVATFPVNVAIADAANNETCRATTLLSI